MDKGDNMDGSIPAGGSAFAGLTKNDLNVLKQLMRDARADLFWRGMHGLADAAGVPRAALPASLDALERANHIKRHHGQFGCGRLTHVEVVVLNIKIIVPAKQVAARGPSIKSMVTCKIHNFNRHDASRETPPKPEAK